MHRILIKYKHLFSMRKNILQLLFTTEENYFFFQLKLHVKFFVESTVKIKIKKKIGGKK